jgi:hypothetical protein
LKSSWTHLIIPFTFSKSGWSVVRSPSLAKGGTSKKRPSPRFHKVPTRSNKVIPRTFQTALVLEFLIKFGGFRLAKSYRCYQCDQNSAVSFKF